MRSIKILLAVSSLVLLALWACSGSPTESSIILGSSSSQADVSSSGTGEQPLSSSGTIPIDPGLSSSGTIPIDPGLSSSGTIPVDPGLSSSGGAQSSASVSSSSVVLPAGTYETLTPANAMSGWGSRYWDGCKPHCAWRENVDINKVPFSICRNCDINGAEIASFTLAPNNKDYQGVESSCNGGPAYACMDMAPVAVNDTLAYAYVATSKVNAVCGQCFQLQFDGGTHNNNNDVKEAHRLLKGKTLIVMASNTGTDVGAGQFDIMIPGGGLGNFNSFSTQLGVSESVLGARSGGLLAACQQEINNYDAPAATFKQCVANKCNAAFGGDAKFANLLRGCQWFVDWFETADNPTYLYKTVECPAQLLGTYSSTINTTAY